VATLRFIHTQRGGGREKKKIAKGADLPSLSVSSGGGERGHAWRFIASYFMYPAGQKGDDGKGTELGDPSV